MRCWKGPQDADPASSGQGCDVLVLDVGGPDANSQERDGQGAEQSQAQAEKWVPAQIDGPEADRKSPEQTGCLKDVEHGLPSHEISPS